MIREAIFKQTPFPSLSACKYTGNVHNLLFVFCYICKVITCSICDKAQNNATIFFVKSDVHNLLFVFFVTYAKLLHVVFVLLVTCVMQT